MASEPLKLAVFLHSGDYDRMHQGLSIAAAGAAIGRPVDVLFFWWALERLIEGRLDEPDFAPPRPDVADRFEARNLPTVRTLLTHLRASGQAVVIACSGSLAALGRDASSVDGRVDQLLGWTSILTRTAGVTDRFYL